MKTRIAILAAAALLTFAMPAVAPVAAFADEDTTASTPAIMVDDQAPAGDEATAPAGDDSEATPAPAQGDEGGEPADDQGSSDDNGGGDTDQ